MFCGSANIILFNCIIIFVPVLLENGMGITYHNCPLEKHISIEMVTHTDFMKVLFGS
jgi:hypothetical protein